jgi:hypothetical protein
MPSRKPRSISAVLHLRPCSLTMTSKAGQPGVRPGLRVCVCVLDSFVRMICLGLPRLLNGFAALAGDPCRSFSHVAARLG